LGKYEKAVESYARAIEYNPLGADGRRAWNNRGAALDNLNRHDEAIDSYDEALLIDPFDIYAWNNKGVALGVLARHEEAISCFLKAIQIEPEYATAWKNLGVAYQSLHRHDEAEEAFMRAEELGL
jgi:superkiller protein 3